MGAGIPSLGHPIQTALSISQVSSHADTRALHPGSMQAPLRKVGAIMKQSPHGAVSCALLALLFTIAFIGAPQTPAIAADSGSTAAKKVR